MSFTAILPHFRTRMDLQDLKEHEDAFSFDNIPRTKYDSVYHLELGTSASLTKAQATTEVLVPITVRLFQRFFKQTNTGPNSRDNAIKTAQDVIEDLISRATYIGTTGIKSINFATMAIEINSEDNDNSAIVNIEMNVLIVLCNR